jgi:hypothetical protein
MTQHERDLAALREKGFGHLSSAQQQRLLANGDAPEPTQRKTYKKDDLVGLDGAKHRGRTFRVEKVNPTTYLLNPLDGGIQVRAQRLLVTAPPVTVTPAGTSQDVPLHDPIAHLVVGTLVRFTSLRNPPAWVKEGDLGVVIVDKGERVNVAPLGGFEDRYMRLPRRAVTVVNPADVINVKPS